MKFTKETFVGEVIAIYVAAVSGGPMQSRRKARLLRGKGVEGDRHCDVGATSPDAHKPDHELTLVEAERIEGFNRDVGVNLSLGDVRRNIVTRAVSLNDLVGKRFFIGDVSCSGLLGIGVC